MRYRERIVRVVGEASGQRALIESLDASGRMFRRAVKWANLLDLRFPAWVLLEKAALVSRIREAQPSRQTSPERATRLLLQILDLERQGSQYDLVDQRKAPRDLHTGLYATYIKTR
jgi:hypothetical protein